MFVVYAITHPDGPEHGIFIGGTLGNPNSAAGIRRHNAKSHYSLTPLEHAMQKGNPDEWRVSVVSEHPEISSAEIMEHKDAAWRAKQKVLKAARVKYGDAVLNTTRRDVEPSKRGADATGKIDPYGLAARKTRAKTEARDVIPDLPDV